jgi:lipoate-protein ligase A
VTLGGRKVVGISQRRNVDGAWLYSMALLRFDAARLASVLGLGPADAGELTTELDARSTHVELDVTALEIAVLGELPAL